MLKAVSINAEAFLNSASGLDVASFAAVIRVVTQRSSPINSGDKIVK